MNKTSTIAWVFLAELALAGAAMAAPQPKWLSAWISPPIGYEPKIKDALGRPLHNETVRQTVRVALGGESLRVRFTNELSMQPVRIGAASIARRGTDGSLVPGTIRPLLFGGKREAVIPTGAPFYSDPINGPVPAGADLVISIYYPNESAPPAHAEMVQVAPGDVTRREQVPGARTVRLASSISGVEVTRHEHGRRVLVTFGDSITEGAGATPGAHKSWPDQAAGLLADKPAGRCWTIVNAGISGNRLLHDGRGPNALARFTRDVLTVPGVSQILLLEGINDIGASNMAEHAGEAVSADEIIAAYGQIAARAHAAGLEIYIGTLLPFEGAAYFSPEAETKRMVVNRWIRSGKTGFDGVIDFETPMRDPAHPMRMRENLQIGDHLHPNDLGYTAMARTAASDLLREPCGSR
jgi:lysophospholipase L1-like esterase